MDTKSIISKVQISNSKGEKIDMLISGNEKSDTVVVFAHGLGSNKHENFNLFDDIASSLEDRFRLVRFDFSGYGQSEGRQEDSCIEKTKGDLSEVLEFAKFMCKKVFIVAHSMGTFAVSSLKALGIERIVFTSPPNTDTKMIIKNTQNRITHRGGYVNEGGITRYLRTSGEEQKLGPDFWRDLRSFNPVGHTKMLAYYSSLAIFDPADDEVVIDRNFNHLVEYKERGIECKSLPGDHNFTKPEDRKRLIEEINTFFRKTKVVFVAHPISGDVEKNIKKVIAICEQIHSDTIIPIFPSLLFRYYLGDTESRLKEVAKQVNREIFQRRGIDEVWYYGDQLSSGMRDEAQLAQEYGIANIGKTPKTALELSTYV